MPHVINMKSQQAAAPDGANRAAIAPQRLTIDEEETAHNGLDRHWHCRHHGAGMVIADFAQQTTNSGRSRTLPYNHLG